MADKIIYWVKIAGQELSAKRFPSFALPLRCPRFCLLAHVICNGISIWPSLLALP